MADDAHIDPAAADDILLLNDPGDDDIDDEDIDPGRDAEERRLVEEEDDGDAKLPASSTKNGDDDATAPLEPSYENFGKLPFSGLAGRLERIWLRNRDKNSPPLPLIEKLKAVMPPAHVLDKLSQPTEDDPSRPQSIFPLLRLLCPEKDGSRSFLAKEATLAKAYTEHFGWSKSNPAKRQLTEWQNAEVVGTSAGDFSMVVYDVLSGGRTGDLPRVDTRPSKVTLAQINRALDDLASIASKNAAKSNHDWRDKKDDGPSKEKKSKKRKAESAASGGRGGKNKKKPNKKASTPERDKKKNKATPQHERRMHWIGQFLDGGALRMSPLEHKWLVRIIQQDMRFGVGFDKLLTWYHPRGPALWSGHNSLKGVCNLLCQPSFRDNRGTLEQNEDEEVNLQTLTVPFYMATSSSEVQLGVPFSPMLSQKTGFHRITTDISGRHRQYVNDTSFGRLGDQHNLSKSLQKRLAESLSIRHPAFCIETKLDGDRMIVHYQHETGHVKIHSRRGVWWSDVYSSVLGPAIRRAVGKWELDLILDGEVLAWDDAKQETVPFGNNRTVAKMRHEWLASQGRLDPRDRDLHKNETEVKKFTMHLVWAFENRDGVVLDMAGDECWIQFVAFDVVFVSGPKAREFLATTISPYLDPQPGSVMHFECMERKKILYRLISPQKDEVEIVQTIVVRPNGADPVNGKDYFSHESPTMESGFAAHALDSIAGIFHDNIPNRLEVDLERSKGLSDEQISQRRAESINAHYSDIVESKYQEGLLFKDLSAPYVLDNFSRQLAYWHKFKPDYFNGGVASDLDVVIVGAYFATGLKHSGKPSSFLCACIDDADSSQFFPFCKVNGASMEFRLLDELLNDTGFQVPKNGSSMQLGKWVRNDNRHATPDYIVTRTYLDNGGGDYVWKPVKKDTPDLWIDPADSVVLTLVAGEIVNSGNFPLALTLRFPRITAMRKDKKPQEIATDKELWDIFNTVEAERTQANADLSMQDGSSTPKSKFGRFLTETQHAQARKSIRSNRVKKILRVKMATKPKRTKSEALLGMKFSVLDGNYTLDPVLDKAKSEGWLEDVESVRNKIDIQAFLQSHGATVMLTPEAKPDCIVLGGDGNDLSVGHFIQAIEIAAKRAKPMKAKASQKSVRDFQMAQCEGVVHWTFPFAVLHKCKATAEEGAIKDSNPDLVQPSLSDFIARPSISFF